MNRPVLFRAAVIVHAVAALFGMLGSLPALMQGPTAEGVTLGIPQIVLVMVAFFGVAGLVSAYGAWRGQKWGIWLTIIIRALDGLLALPGVLSAPNLVAQSLATASVLIGVFVIFALLRRTANPQST